MHPTRFSAGVIRQLESRMRGVRAGDAGVRCLSDVVKRLLFVCSQNRLRSPTAEQVFSGRPGLEVSSAGLNNSATVPVSAELIEWADIIFVMEKSHRNKLSKKFNFYLRNKRVICLDIPDEYEYMDQELVALLEERVRHFVRDP